MRANVASGSAQAGSAFTVLLAGVAMAGALSMVIYQVMSGPMASMVRVSNKTVAKTQLTSVSNIVIMDALNQPASGDCDGDGVVEPREWRTTAGDKPTNGGLIPNNIGAPLTDPWGSEYGYCVWDTGVQNDPAVDNGCGAGVNRLLGSPDTTVGDENTQYVVAVISAGSNRQFETTCNAYVNGTTSLLTETGDDVIQKFTYSEASSATSSIWKLKVGDPDVAEIGKNISVDSDSAAPAAAQRSDISNYTTGVMRSLAVVTSGLIEAGGAIRLANDTAVTSCTAGNEGDMRYNSVTDNIEVCGEEPPNSGTYVWKESSGGASGFTQNRVPFADATGSLIENTSDNFTWDNVNDALKVGRKVKFVGVTGGAPIASTGGLLAEVQPFSFTNKVRVALSTAIESDVVAPVGITSPTLAFCSGGCTAVAKNGIWGGTLVILEDGDTIQIRQMSAASGNTTTTASLVIGNTLSDDWTVTTVAEQDVQNFGPGSHTWTKPVDHPTTSTVRIVCVGGGAGGSGGLNVKGCGGMGLSGGGGGTIATTVPITSLAATEAVTVGGGGAGSAFGVATGAGGSSTFAGMTAGGAPASDGITNAGGGGFSGGPGGNGAAGVPGGGSGVGGNAGLYGSEALSGAGGAPNNAGGNYGGGGGADSNCGTGRSGAGGYCRITTTDTPLWP